VTGQGSSKGDGAAQEDSRQAQGSRDQAIFLCVNIESWRKNFKRKAEVF